MRKRSKFPNRKPVVVPLTPEIQARQDHVVVVFPLDATLLQPGSRMTVGIRFISPEHLLTTFEELMNAAVEVWPDNAWIQEYLSSDD